MSSKKKKSPKSQAKAPTSLQISEIYAKTPNQTKAFEAWEEDKNLVLTGAAGSGKTFLALYLGLCDMEDDAVDKVIVIRSAVPSRDIGFLPGKIDEKTEIYEDPLYDLCATLYNRGDAYEILNAKKCIEFTTTSFLRGITFRNCVVIVDELQNMSYEESRTIITRLGENTKIMFLGDIMQTDFKDKKQSGMDKFVGVLKQMDSFAVINFGIDDIVRSGLVRDFLIAESKTIDPKMGF